MLRKLLFCFAMLVVAGPAAADDAMRCFREAGDVAVAACTRAINSGGRTSINYLNRGVAYHNKGDTDRAIADYTAAIRLDPKNANAYVGRGGVYTHKRDIDLAVADLDEAIRLNPKAANAYFNRGLAYHGTSFVNRAIADYSEAIRLDPKDANAYVWRGLAYERIADSIRARSDFETALEFSQTSTKWAQEMARERLAALTSTPPATTPLQADVATANVPSAIPVRDLRIALVIGNSAYENVAALPNPERDANLVADALKRSGFETVTLLTNLRKDALVSALRDFAARAETADWAVVYYAGHGMEVGGINYLIPTDAKITADRDIGFEAVSLGQVLNAAERAKKLRLVILDACRDNPFANQMKRTLTVVSRSVSRGLAAVEPEAGTLVVYAAKDGETALDGDGINSPFASAFVKNLPTPGLEVRRLFDFVRDDVMEVTGRKQKPFSYGSISGSFCIASNFWRTSSAFTSVGNATSGRRLSWQSALPKT
jgi:Flp pilus assembly protein TadD